LQDFPVLTKKPPGQPICEAWIVAQRLKYRASNTSEPRAKTKNPARLRSQPAGFLCCFSPKSASRGTRV
jgi:hypothetical protein